jgi:predicted RNase H-like nuclease (RuvC/YqgF family)
LKKTLYQRYCPNLLCQPEANLKAENERLKETAKIAIQEIGAWSRKAGKLEAENERLKKTIRNQSEQVQHLADNLQEARGEAERLKAWILKIKLGAV